MDARLARLRGPVAPKRHNARTIAALTGNPGCARRAVLDAAGVDKEALARGVGFPARFGQSPFAIARGNAFEAMVKADGCAELLRLLRGVLGDDLTAARYTDLDPADGAEDPDLRHAESRTALTAAVPALNMPALPSLEFLQKLPPPPRGGHAPRPDPDPQPPRQRGTRPSR